MKAGSPCDHWMEVASDTAATAEALRNVAVKYHEALLGNGFSLLVWEAAYPRFLRQVENADRGRVWRELFEETIAAHPNLPPDLLGNELMISEAIVTGLLRNPMAPLLTLEKPDFIEGLTEEQEIFARIALSRPELPASLAQALASIRDPWLALEARTHVALESSPIPDLTWLEQQVVQRLPEGSFEARCLLYELQCHGLIAAAGEVRWENPWAGVNPLANLNDAAFVDRIDLCIREAQKAVLAGRRACHQWREKWKWGRDPERLPYRYAILAHPDVPFWVSQEAARKGLSSCRIFALQHPDVSTGIITQCRKRAILDVLSIGDRDVSPGLFYLVLRDLADPLTATYLHVARLPLSERIKNDHFLIRLAIVLRLDDAKPEHQELRASLLEDPNGYVRAAARRELAWSSSETKKAPAAQSDRGDI